MNLQRWPCFFFVEGRLIASGSRGVEVIENINPRGFQQWKPNSYAFFCETCGNVWARAHVEGRRYNVWSLPCSKCPPTHRYTVPGSIWLPWDRSFNESFPLALLQHEVKLHLAWAEANDVGAWND